MNFKHELLGLDHREFSEDASKQLAGVLKTFGISSYLIPNDSDMYTILLANKPLTKAELKQLKIEYRLDDE